MPENTQANGKRKHAKGATIRLQAALSRCSRIASFHERHLMNDQGKLVMLPSKIEYSGGTEMRRLKILHVTRYLYPEPVRPLTHKLMLRPREGHDVRIESSRLEILPRGNVLWHRDVHDNSVAMVEFNEETTLLEFSSEVVIQHYEDDQTVFQPHIRYFPFLYEPGERADLVPYLHPLFARRLDTTLQDWIDMFWKPGQTLPIGELLQQINNRIHDTVKYEKREAIGVQRPSETLKHMSGSCRDLATLFMEACRYLGFAARFVSGYRYEPNLPPAEGATHAWCEVYLTGAGWRGFDSTTGERVGGEHIAVAVARHPEWVPPISGRYLGEAKSTMEVEVQVEELE